MERGLLDTIKEDFAAITRRAHSEVNPVGRAPLLQNQLIEIPFGTIRDVEQDASHADYLLRTIALDIHRAAREVIRILRTPTLPIHFLRTIATRNDDGDVMLLIAIQRILAIAKIFQPILTDVLQILNGHMRRDIPIRRVITRLAELPKRKVRR